ncbi:MAG: ATPase, T2SS/T4P/T4SS family [Candidatus Hodarchaeales archaeon]|jgi:type IV secretory pathway ATPase VirB11/archaellum biosynthesis ATPase
MFIENKTKNTQSLDHEIISYEFLYVVVSIRKKVEDEMYEYHYRYKKRVMDEIKNFFEYETILREEIKDYIINKQDFATFEEILVHLTNLPIKEKIPKIVFIPVLLRTLNMERIGPLLIDDYVDEIYLDSENSPIYIDHSKYGRCSTRIFLKKNEISTFINRIALENGFNLNRENPTMKGDFKSSLFHSRVTVDIPPLLLNDIHLDIRKFRATRLGIDKLIALGSLTAYQGDFLINIMKDLVSISIIGPPNSGKTTLQNAILQHLPSHYRVLSVEDVLESSDLRKGHTIRFRLGYDPGESNIYTKAMEIQKILHRSPDYVNLGELSTKDHFMAYLNVLSIGVPSIQTIHGKNSDYFLLRLNDIYKIPLSLIKASIPHVFIEMITMWNGGVRKRMVSRILHLSPEGIMENIHPFKQRN